MDAVNADTSRDEQAIVVALQEIATLPLPMDRVIRLQEVLDRLETEQEGRHNGLVWMQLFANSIALNHEDLLSRGWLDPGTGRAELPPNNPWALLTLARYLQSIGVESQALQVLDHAQTLRPGNLLIKLWRAHGMARLGQWEQADELFEFVGRRYGSPARIIRMGSRGWAWVHAKPHQPESDASWQWLIRPPDRIGTLLLVSVDGRYWLHYGQRLLQSWADVTKTASKDSVLHVHLLNADASTQEHASQLVRASTRASLCHENLVFPELSRDTSGRSPQEYGTCFACKRLLVLPWWLERVTEGVVVTDVDTVWRADPSQIWPALQCSGYAADAGAVQLKRAGRLLWEDWSMTLAAFRATGRAQGLAVELAAYVNRFLSEGNYIWLLDQMALASAFENCNWRTSHEPSHMGTRIAALPDDWMDWGNGPVKPSALLWTSVASVEQAQIEATNQAWLQRHVVECS